MAGVTRQLVAVALDLQQINTAVNQMDQDTQKNAAMVEETTAAIHSLSREVSSLNELIALFKVTAVAPKAPNTAYPTVVSPPHSPARDLRRRLIGASGNSATLRREDWEEF